MTTQLSNISLPKDSTESEHAEKSAGEALVIPVMEEKIEIEKIVEQIGAVRVLKKACQEKQNVEIDGYQESIETQRVSVNRIVDKAEAPRQEGHTLIVPVYEERWIKQLVLKEEIWVTVHHKRTHQQLLISLRKEEAKIERLNMATQEWRTE